MASSGVIIAFPPYLTTMVWPFREEIEEAIVMAFSANASEEEKSDDDVDVKVTDFCADINGANACDVLAIDAARSKLLAENSFIVAMAVYGIFLGRVYGKVRKCQVQEVEVIDFMHAVIDFIQGSR